MKTVLFPQMDKRDRYSFFPCTACTAAPVGIYFSIVGQAEVDNMRQVINIKSAGCNIGCNQQAEVSRPEFVHDCVALRL